MIAIFLIQLLQHQIYLPEDLQIVNKTHSATESVEVNKRLE